MTPLSGIRVLDLTNVLAGPFCCHQLAHLGAEVIKVEAPGRGDLARNLGSDPELNARGMGISFLAQNAGKKSLTLNLKHPKGKAILGQLVVEADVLVENFRPGVMAKLGLDFEALCQHNPRLIYAAISGFGQEGAWVKRPAYDQIIQGMSGVMSITGAPDTAPYRVGYPLADTIGGLTAAFAVAAALQDRSKAHFIDVSMLEATIATMGWVVSNYLIGGTQPAAHGNENTTSAPSGTFQTGEGLINIAANKDEQWVLLAQHIGRPELTRHPDFINREARKTNRFRLKGEIEQALSAKSAAQWEVELNAIGVPAGQVLSLPQVLASPTLQNRGMIASFAQPPGVERDIQSLRTGIKWDGAAPQVEAPPPLLGQHTAEILGKLGHHDLEQLKTEGVI
jgi:formyl-CoA transferase